MAIHNSAPAESINQSRTFGKVRNIESVVGGLGGVRGDKGGDFAIQAPLSPLQNNSLQTTLESSNNAQKAESTFAKIDSSALVESMDAAPTPMRAPKNARNDSVLDSKTHIALR